MTGTGEDAHLEAQYEDRFLSDADMDLDTDEELLEDLS